MDSPRKRVAFAPQHESVQRGPDGGNLVDFQPPISQKYHINSALEAARQRVQELERLMEQTQMIEQTSTGFAPPHTLLLPAPNSTPYPIQQLQPIPPPSARAPPASRFKSTFMLPGVFGKTTFDDQEQVCAVLPKLSACSLPAASRGFLCPFCP